MMLMEQLARRTPGEHHVIGTELIETESYCSSLRAFVYAGRSMWVVASLHPVSD